MGPIELMPLGDLSISRTLKRDLRKAGARTLAEAFALDDRSIIMNLSDQSERELMGYERMLERDPERLRKVLLSPSSSKHDVHSEVVTHNVGKHAPQAENRSKTVTYHSSRGKQAPSTSDNSSRYSHGTFHAERHVYDSSRG